VVDQQQLPGLEAADGEARIRPAEAGVADVAPAFAAVVAEALADSVVGAHQHPPRAALLLDQHVFVETAVGDVGADDEFKRPAAVAGDREVRAGDCGVFRQYFLRPQRPGRGGERPGSVGEHRRLVHHHPFGDAARLVPDRGVGVGRSADRNPDPAAAVENVSGFCGDALRPDPPEAAPRVEPEGGVEGAFRNRVVRRDDLDLLPGESAVGAGGEDHVVAGAFVIEFAAVPDGEKPPRG